MVVIPIKMAVIHVATVLSRVVIKKRTKLLRLKQRLGHDAKISDVSDKNPRGKIPRIYGTLKITILLIKPVAMINFEYAKKLIFAAFGKRYRMSCWL